MASLKVAQVSDTHLFCDPRGRLLGCTTLEALQQVLRSPRLQEADLFLLTGDLSQDGTAESYERIESLFAPFEKPCYFIPGNHDSDLLPHSLTHPRFSGDLEFIRNGWRFILLSSRVPGEVHGFLDAATLQKLSHCLQNDRETPTVIVLHHPPVAVGSPWLDQIGLINHDDFFDAIAGHENIRLVIAGHVHQDYYENQKGVDYYCTRSTCIQFKPSSIDFALDPARSPGFRFFEFFEDGTYSTETVDVSYECALEMQVGGY